MKSGNCSRHLPRETQIRFSTQITVKVTFNDSFLLQFLYRRSFWNQLAQLVSDFCFALISFTHWNDFKGKLYLKNYTWILLWLLISGHFHTHFKFWCSFKKVNMPDKPLVFSPIKFLSSINFFRTALFTTVCTLLSEILTFKLSVYKTIQMKAINQYFHVVL